MERSRTSFIRLKTAWDCKEYEDAKAVLDQIAEDYQEKYPDLADFVSEHAWETLGVYHAALVAHHKRLRITNMIERVNRNSREEARWCGSSLIRKVA